MDHETEPLFEEELDYVNEDHIHAFAKALVWDEMDHDPAPVSKFPEDEVELATQEGVEGNAVLTPGKPIKITSKSDWYPVHREMIRKKEKSKKKDRVANEFRASIGYTLLRWPLLTFVGMWIIFLCVLYSIVRFYVALSEYYLTWIGQRKKLRDNLRNSKTYEEWVENALALDRYLNLDKWSINSKFSYYDYKTIRLTISKLKALKKDSLDHELLVFLQGCLKTNFAGIENRQLYSHRYFGTKHLVEEYVQVVTECIDHITDSKNINIGTKRKFFRIASKNYGKSALCLSGGACFAYTHFGVIKALLDNDSLPSIISGTSGGGLIAALACTRTDDELRQLLVPQLARKITACEDPWYIWLPRFWKTGARFDTIAWAKKAQFFTRGSMTFQESMKRSGRKLNISTVPADPHSPVILCNNITSPNCIIWSALLASSAVPGILKPVVLMMKNPNADNEIIPFSLGNKWRDGSLRTDIPIDSLNTYYNVNFTIVSQVNPHISLFFYAPKGTVGRPVAISRRYTHKQQFESFRGGFIGTAIEQLLRLEITKWLKIIKSLDLLPHFLEQDWSNIWLQRFSGSITVWPRNRLKDFWYILSDPTEERLEEMLMKGQRSMFPRLHFIKHRLSIERAIERGRKVAKLSNNIKQDSPQEGPNGDFRVHNVEYDDDETDSSEDERIGPSPFDKKYGDSDEEPYLSESRTASPEFAGFNPGDYDSDDTRDRRRYTIF
ncbi:patatin-like phospholipase domain-containing protein [[Candida] jaroonii]|uniref:Patatin-like phospholipase domain-containing protein n=1 Tax=[Candida] jaroonii TaxID=467808 RepID=A0ACA9Y4Y2_9ASCO|nr:patatin-like phospholipase domain-containing protein [[Candida] jaroonii]